MNFDWGLYLQLARELGGRPDDASKRTAVSRAYYSAYHAANDFLKANGIATDAARGSHVRVWRVYVKSSKPECVRIGVDGLRLKDARVDADYRPDKQFSDSRIQRCLQDSERVINSVPGHPPEGFVAQSSNRISRAVRCFIKCMKA